MSEASRTPGPWSVVEDHRDSCFDIQGRPNGEWIAEEIERKADARFIVTACNAHDDLVTALEVAERALRKSNYVGVKRDQIDAALARATEGGER